jgi:hypothetical protein
MKMNSDETTRNALDLRHIGRFYDKDMEVDEPGMEMSKPGLPDLRRRRHSVGFAVESQADPPENPPQTQR